MEYDLKKLYGSWYDSENDNILKLDSDGDFKITIVSDGSRGMDLFVKAFGSVRGSWKVESGKLILHADLRSMRPMAWLRLIPFGMSVFSIVLRISGEDRLVEDKIIRLTGKDMWLEEEKGYVTKYSKKKD